MGRERLELARSDPATIGTVKTATLFAVICRRQRETKRPCCAQNTFHVAYVRGSHVSLLRAHSHEEIARMGSVCGGLRRSHGHTTLHAKPLVVLACFSSCVLKGGTMCIFTWLSLR